MYGAHAVPCSKSIPLCQPTGQHNLKYHIKTFAHCTDTYTCAVDILRFSSLAELVFSRFHGQGTSCSKASAMFTLPRSYSVSRMCSVRPGASHTVCGGKNLTLSFGSCVDKSIIVSYGTLVSP